MWRRPDTRAWIQENKSTESLKTHQDGTPETLKLMGTMHSDRIFFRNWPRQYGIDNIPGAIDVEEGTLNMAVCATQKRPATSRRPVCHKSSLL